jgi:hypothetical protein
VISSSSLTASRLLPVEIRQWFLSRVADALSNIRHPADGRVRRAITDVLNSVRTPIPLGLFDQWQGRR